MNLASIPEFANPVKAHLRRSAWGQFPDVVIHAEESAVKKHPLYTAAKGGEAAAAEGLLLETISLNAIVTLCEIMGREQIRLLPVHALEAEGLNVIPRVMAQIIGRMLALPIETGVLYQFTLMMPHYAISCICIKFSGLLGFCSVFEPPLMRHHQCKLVLQINRVRHTGASGYRRLASPALFDGDVKPEKYLLVDDFIGQGGTLANLKGYLESRGAAVIGATTLTGKAYSSQTEFDGRNFAELAREIWNRTRRMVACCLRLWL